MKAKTISEQAVRLFAKRERDKQWTELQARGIRSERRAVPKLPKLAGKQFPGFKSKPSYDYLLIDKPWDPDTDHILSDALDSRDELQIKINMPDKTETRLSCRVISERIEESRDRIAPVYAHWEMLITSPRPASKV